MEQMPPQNSVAIYDFDGTIYDGDSSADFYTYCLFRRPRMWLCLPCAFACWVLYMLRMIDKTRLKQKLFSFVTLIPDIDTYIASFWETHTQHIKAWYLAQKQETDIIISASPEFLLAPACHRLGVTLIGSIVDKHTGEFTGKNCWGEEKIHRLTRYFGTFPNASAFYTDSAADTPLCKRIPNSYLVRGEKIIPWK